MFLWIYFIPNIHPIYAVNMFGIPRIWLFVNNDISEQNDSQTLIEQSGLKIVAEHERKNHSYAYLSLA